MSILHFTVHKTVEEKYYFRLRNIGGELLLTSRNYSSLHNCLNDIYSLQIHRDFLLEDQRHAECMHYSYVLKTSWGMVIGQSALYVSLGRMLQDMQVIGDSLHEAAVEDRTTHIRFFRTMNSKI